MTINELVEKYSVEEAIVSRAIVANGFTITDIDDSNEYLVAMYIDYLVAEESAKKARDAFRYTDGEETVDKSKVFENYRRHYMDLFNVWKDAKKIYDNSIWRPDNSAFHVRKRAPHLDRRRASVRRPFRRGY